MRPRDRGTIVQVGSALGHRGIPLQAPYCGAKHAIQGFTESVRTELRARGAGVHVGLVNLPGLNTTQFEHCRSKMPRHPMPVPPVYQPELAAEAIAFAARTRRRELNLGLPTLYTIWGNRLAPWLVERYLARTAIDGQQADGPPAPANGDGNLFAPVPGDAGTHGPFDDRSRSRSPQLWLTRRRGAIAGVVAAGAAAAIATGVRR